MTIKAVYDNGVFRPTEAVSLPQGTTAEVVVGVDPRGAADFFKRIAAMPLEPGGEKFSNREHDRILYGWKDKK